MPSGADEAGLQHAPTERIVPEQLGQFAVTGVLGRGGSGVVYAARLGEQEVALKVLRQDQVPTEKERRRFLAEARNMARIAHPGVVSVVAVGELDDGRPYLAMERLHGTNLAERVAAAPIPRAQALDLFQQLASAVAAMHANDLIHRDLKPENVMLVDGGARAVLLDFGIARATDAPPSTTTQAGMQRGTPAVMAPERFFGARATLRTDVYELAVVLYVMLTRSLPWRDVLDAKERLNPLRPRDLGVSLSDALEAALMRALSATADERPASVAELAGDVRRACAEPEANADGAEGGVAVGPAQERLQLATAPTAAATTERTRPARGVRALLGVALVGVGGLAAFALWTNGRAGDDTGIAPSAQPAPAAEGAGPDGAPPVSVSAIPLPRPDAGSHAASASPAAGDRAPVEPDAAPRRSARPKQRKRPRPPDGGDTEATTDNAAAPLPWCRKIAALYCTEEFKATEGTMAGALCKNFNQQVITWEKMPPEAAAQMEASCKGMYPKLAEAAAERIRFGKSLGSGGGKKPE